MGLGWGGDGIVEVIGEGGERIPYLIMVVIWCILEWLGYKTEANESSLNFFMVVLLLFFFFFLFFLSFLCTCKVNLIQLCSFFFYVFGM